MAQDLLFVQNLIYQRPPLGDGLKLINKGENMRRDEYLRNRKLQGVDTHISRTQDQIRRTKQRKEELKARFESHKRSHEQALTRIDDQVTSLESKIALLEEQKKAL